jgi:hypothetical protein
MRQQSRGLLLLRPGQLPLPGLPPPFVPSPQSEVVMTRARLTAAEESVLVLFTGLYPRFLSPDGVVFEYSPEMGVFAYQSAARCTAPTIASLLRKGFAAPVHTDVARRLNTRGNDGPRLTLTTLGSEHVLRMTRVAETAAAAPVRGTSRDEDLDAGRQVDLALSELAEAAARVKGCKARLDEFMMAPDRDMDGPRLEEPAKVWARGLDAGREAEIRTTGLAMMGEWFAAREAVRKRMVAVTTARQRYAALSPWLA